MELADSNLQKEILRNYQICNESGSFLLYLIYRNGAFVYYIYYSI
jgi:hypothetical protein